MTNKFLDTLTKSVNQDDELSKPKADFNSKRGVNFGRMFRRAQSVDNKRSDYFITRCQFITMTGLSPSFFHGVLQQRKDFPSVVHRERKRNFYLLSEVNAFLDVLKAEASKEAFKRAEKLHQEISDVKDDLEELIQKTSRKEKK